MYSRNWIEARLARKRLDSLRLPMIIVDIGAYPGR